MSLSRTPLSFEASVPGKVFLLGEYAVMAGAPAVVATLRPRFVLRSTRGGEPAGELGPFHAESPAGRLLERVRKRNPIELEGVSFHFSDPYEGAGGFGASTAQFGLLAAALAKLGCIEMADAYSVWSLYRALGAPTSGKAAASGADLFAQMSGGVVFFDVLNAKNARQVLLDGWSVMVFSASGQVGRKVPTHEHLESLDPKRIEEVRGALSPVLDRAGTALEVGDMLILGRAMTQFAEILSENGLEHERAREDRLALCKVPGVVGAKGCGALLADALVAVVPAEETQERVKLLASERGLRFVSTLSLTEEGFRWRE